MKFVLPLSYRECVSLIRQEVEDNDMDDVVRVIVKPEEMIVKVSMHGTSRMTFSVKQNQKSTQFELEDEEISFFHKKYRKEIRQYLKEAIKAGGGELAN